MVVLLTIGALTYFDVFNTTRFVSESCETGAQISCSEIMLTEQGELRIKLANNYPVDIVVERITVTNRQRAETWTYSNNDEIKRGASKTISFGVGSGYSRNSKEIKDIEIEFRRDVEGARRYTITGSAVIRPMPPGV